MQEDFTLGSWSLVGQMDIKKARAKKGSGVLTDERHREPRCFLIWRIRASVELEREVDSGSLSSDASGNQAALPPNRKALEAEL